MEATKIIRLDSIGDIWNQLLPDFSTGIALHDYHVKLEVDGHTIDVDISSSPGGNMEGGYESTSIRAAVPAHPDFVFVIHPEDFLNKIGKLFGMQDVVLGYPEFDRNVIVKTTDAGKAKAMLSDVEVRQVFQTLSGYSLRLDTHEDSEDHYLDLGVQRAVNDLNELKRLLSAFYTVLLAVTPRSAI